MGKGSGWDLESVLRWKRVSLRQPDQFESSDLFFARRLLE